MKRVNRWREKKRSLNRSGCRQVIGKENKDESTREAQIKDGGFSRKGEVDESSKKTYL